MIQHVYPVNDLEEHDLTSGVQKLDIFETDFGPEVEYINFPKPNCKCNPTIKIVWNNRYIVVHNSFDGREGLELANEILNK